MTTEVERPAGGTADQEMKCNEEEEEVLQEKDDEGLQEDADPPPVHIIPLPVQPNAENSCGPLTDSSAMESAGASLSFRVNGQLVPLLPGGGTAKLKLRAHPEGSASGFTTVQIPVTLTLHSPAGIQYISTTASLSASPAPAPTPIITGVICGEAAQKVLIDHNVNFNPPTGLKNQHSAAASPFTSSQATPPPAPGRTKKRPSSRSAAPHTLLHKGELGPVRPPDCLVCTSQYKLITELRGFMCMCSPAIMQSLRNLKRKKKSKHHRGSRDKIRTLKPSRDSQTNSRVSKTRPGPSASKGVSPSQRAHWSSGDLLTSQVSASASLPSLCDPSEPDLFGSLPSSPHGKLVILVEDFYYGSAPGQHPKKCNLMGAKYSEPYRCIHCPKTLDNNIELMSHMQQHVSMIFQWDSAFSCPHCSRHFLSAGKLQSHVEAVHNQCESKATCRICELAFESEPAFLWHMKTTHKPGEMPYICQECGFRSSFYSDVWFHFEECHTSTRNFMCQYCLRVLRRNTCYQQHFIRHQKKREFGCDKCRLHFLYIKELVEHRVLYHRTHIRPPQLSGLKPGTKVTVRAYSVVGESEGEGPKTTVASCKVVDVALPTSSQEVPQRKPVETLGSLLLSLNPDRLSRPLQRCLECLNSVPDLRTHYPSLVHCSLCRFITCCSTSYANHMINNHATCKKVPPYQTIFQSDPKLPDMLMCVTCKLLTCRGDLMANHLTEKPKHTCIMLAHTESGMTYENETVSEPRESGADTQSQSDSTTCSGSEGGAFIPIHLLPSSSTQLSVRPLLSSSSFSSQPAMTIKFLGPRSVPGQAPVPLLLSQLSIMLSSLCHGITVAAHHHCTSPTTIRSWIRQQQRSLRHRLWSWKTEEMAEWVLERWEQQQIVTEELLLLAARAALGGDGRPEDWYSWTVDFMLRHDLGPQTTNRNVSSSFNGKSRRFIDMLRSQSRSPHSLGCMDELPVFIDLDKFSSQSPASFQLYGLPEDRPVFDVIISALSDGGFLPPLLFFTGAAPDIPEGFPENVVLEARAEGFTDQDRLRIWIEKVWHPCVASQRNSSCLLIADVHRGHQTDAFRRALSSVCTDVIFIPSGCSSRLQPLDVCVTRVLRDFLQTQWIQLVSTGGLDGLGLDQLALTLACWLSEFSSTLNSEKHVMHRWECLD
uniref:C2H2-type domain-containing protein n=1 Tax=Haplochromis burtoni TaxID=8153 RepID=A0A3Q3CHA3_HAPBU